MSYDVEDATSGNSWNVGILLARRCDSRRTLISHGSVVTVCECANSAFDTLKTSLGRFNIELYELNIRDFRSRCNVARRDPTLFAFFDMYFILCFAMSYYIAVYIATVY